MAKLIDSTARVARHAVIGKGTRIGAFTIVEDGVTVGENSVIEPFCHLGHPPAGGEAGKLIIGKGALIRSHSVVYAGSIIGAGLKTGHHVSIRENSTIGDRFQLGSYGDVQGSLTIGNDVRTQSHVYLCQFSEIDDFVWLFPGAMLANDPHPPSDSCTKGPRLRRSCVIGMGAIVAPAVTVGEDSVVGAAALVREDVAAGTVVVGVPARAIGKASDVRCREGALKQVYPWRHHFHRGYRTAGGKNG